MKYFQAIDFVWEVLIAIALPTVVFALGGRWVDRKLGTTPLFVILGLAVSLTVAYLLISRKAKRFLKEQNKHD